MRDDEHENMEKVAGPNSDVIRGEHVAVEKVKLKQLGKAEEEVEEDTSVDVEEEDLCEDGCCKRENCRDCPKKLCNWFCGLDADSAESTAQNEHLEKLTCLEQDPKAKTFLNVNLVIILLLGFFLFAIFSVKDHWKPSFWNL